MDVIYNIFIFIILIVIKVETNYLTEVFMS